MKRIGLISILMGLGLMNISAQVVIKRIMINPTEVTLTSDPSLKVRGALYQVKKSSILISNSTSLEDYTMGNSNFNLSEIDIMDIQYIETRIRTRVRNGARIGAATGFLIGAVWAFIDSQQPTDWDIGPEFPVWAPPLMGGILLAPVGAFIGAIAGSIYVKIPINGSMNNYNRNKARLIKYSLMK